MNMATAAETLVGGFELAQYKDTLGHSIPKL